MLHPLEKPPESKSWTVRKLVAAARDGLLRVPQFQRGLRWDSGDVRDLFDSIRNGYPIGTLLLWKRREPAPAGIVAFGPVTFDAPQTTDALWVVDGQQRTTALTAALLHALPDLKSRADDYEFYFDLQSEAFVRRAARLIPPDTWLPLWEVIDSNRLHKWLEDHKAFLDDELRAKAFRVATTIQEYEVPSVIVESENDRVLREVFRRTNNTGRRLNQTEVFNAIYSPGPGEQPSSLNEIAHALQDLRFGNVSRLPYRQSVLSMRGVEPTSSVRSRHFDDPQWTGAIGDATRALRRAIVFLKADARIPVAQLVPYAALFTLLGRFFQQFPEPSTRTKELLSRWVWRAAASGQLRGDVGKIRSAFRAIDKTEEASVDKLLILAGRSDINIEPSADFRTSSGKLTALALLENQPVDLESGKLVDLELLFAEADSNPFERIFRRNVAKPLLKATGNFIIGLAAPRTPWERRIGDSLARGTEEMHFCHFIHPAAASAFKRGDFETFIRERTSAIARATHELLLRRTRLNETDRPSLAAIAAVEA